MRYNPSLRSFQYELEAIAHSLQDIASASGTPVSEDALRETFEIANALVKLSQMEFFINGGRSLKAFLELGDRTIKQCEDLKRAIRA